MIANYTSQLAQFDFFADWSSLPPFTTEIDPFDYCGRLGVYKLLIEALNVNGAFGAFNEKNLFWGYVFQLAWQRRSGRLTLPNTEAGRIHPHSLWGYANHAMSVIPLIAAINSGLINPLRILPPYERGIIDYAHGGGSSPYIVPEAFVDALPAWNAVFKQALDLRPGDDLDPLRRSFWQAHQQSILAVEPTIVERGHYYHTKPELDFLIGWLRLDEFLGVALWNTDLDGLLAHGLGALPERVLISDDRPGRIRNLSPLVNANLRMIVNLTRQSKLRFAFTLFLWRRAMRSPEARADMQTLLVALFNPSKKNRRERLRLYRYMLLP